MFQIEGFTGYFTINGVPYQRGQYRYLVNGDRVNIYEIGTANKISIVGEIGVLFSQYRDNLNAPFAYVQALIDYLDNNIFLS